RQRGSWAAGPRSPGWAGVRRGSPGRRRAARSGRGPARGSRSAWSRWNWGLGRRRLVGRRIAPQQACARGGVEEVEALGVDCEPQRLTHVRGRARVDAGGEERLLDREQRRLLVLALCPHLPPLL